MIVWTVWRPGRVSLGDTGKMDEDRAAAFGWGAGGMPQLDYQRHQ